MAKVAWPGGKETEIKCKKELYRQALRCFVKVNSDVTTAISKFAPQRDEPATTAFSRGLHPEVVHMQRTASCHPKHNNQFAPYYTCSVWNQAYLSMRQKQRQKEENLVASHTLQQPQTGFGLLGSWWAERGATGFGFHPRANQRLPRHLGSCLLFYNCLWWSPRSLSTEVLI